MKSFSYSRFVMLSLGALLLCGALTPHAALARKTGDMITDSNWYTPRPFVHSDYYRGRDMFRSIPLAYNRNADVFDRMRSHQKFDRADMFPRWKANPPPYPILREWSQSVPPKTPQRRR